jgi:protein tyrosine phosphatase (PTP) superfamily phosphohydrolase (DUF442 family)
MSVEEILNYLSVNDNLVTGGQPTVEQLRAAASAGFSAVINLAGKGARLTLVGEADFVRSLGMTYFHIPVDWENPTAEDFADFERLMRFVSTTKTLLHCAANYRVTAFYSLYAQKHLGWTEEQAINFRQQVWDVSEYPIWEHFITQIQSTFGKEVNLMDETQSTPIPEAAAPVELEQPVSEETEVAESDDKIVSNTLAVSVNAGNDAKIDNSLVLGAVVAGNDASLSDGAAITMVAGANIELTDGGALMAVVGGDTHVKQGGIGILIGGGDVHLEEGSQILMTSRDAAIFGAVAGAVLAVFSLLFRLLRKK